MELPIIEMRMILEEGSFLKKNFLKIFLKMWTIFKVFIEFVTVLILFYVSVFLVMRHMGFQLPN